MNRRNFFQLLFGSIGAAIVAKSASVSPAIEPQAFPPDIVAGDIACPSPNGLEVWSMDGTTLKGYLPVPQYLYGFNGKVLK